MFVPARTPTLTNALLSRYWGGGGGGTATWLALEARSITNPDQYIKVLLCVWVALICDVIWGKPLNQFALVLLPVKYYLTRSLLGSLLW